ncbi:hypothetical protein DAPPUDRAFT_261060 [Daphnia pulex]|uniref:Uncharacterized protein n=1 Tax=Daphnia pulex TaxID=6669 RepID=E9HKG7_DAPPU|nr:hypothetical protein DAPPUDRAFT_261060 [Daphnia pulex]|eukprot:EFX67788.1 hypothetical protein DAPPUDRAFT_261060 [Daphnia pulex]
MLRNQGSEQRHSTQSSAIARLTESIRKLNPLAVNHYESGVQLIERVRVDGERFYIQVQSSPSPNGNGSRRQLKKLQTQIRTCEQEFCASIERTGNLKGDGCRICQLATHCTQSDSKTFMSRSELKFVNVRVDRVDLGGVCRLDGQEYTLWVIVCPSLVDENITSRISPSKEPIYANLTLQLDIHFVNSSLSLEQLQQAEVLRQSVSSAPPISTDLTWRTLYLTDVGKMNKANCTQLYRLNHPRRMDTPTLALECRLWGVHPADKNSDF